MELQGRIQNMTARRGIRYIRPVAPSSAHGLVADVYAQIKRDAAAVVPPMSLHSPVPTVLAGSWAIFRETTVATGTVPRRAKEAVAATVSHLNACPYCADVHTTTLYAFADHALADAILTDRPDQIHDPALRSLTAWAMSTSSPGAEILDTPPFSRQAAPEIIGTAVTFHYLNRMVNVFIGESPFPQQSPRLKRLLKRLIGPLLTGMLHRSVRPGVSLTLLPDSALPEDLGWAAPHPIIASAFARAAAAIEAVGHDALPEAVRALVREQVQAWDGRDPGRTRQWVEDAIRGLPTASMPAARLALLVALASYRVDQATIDDFRATTPGDEALIGATAWASFTAARRIGTWLHRPVILAAAGHPVA